MPPNQSPPRGDYFYVVEYYFDEVSAVELTQSSTFQQASSIVRYIATEGMKKAGMNSFTITAAWIKAQIDYLKEKKSCKRKK